MSITPTRPVSDTPRGSTFPVLPLVPLPLLHIVAVTIEAEVTGEEVTRTAQNTSLVGGETGSSGARSWVWAIAQPSWNRVCTPYSSLRAAISPA